MKSRSKPMPTTRGGEHATRSETVAALCMLVNSALFFAAAAVHFGARLGPMTEPVLAHSAVIEIVCGLVLALGSAGLVIEPRSRNVPVAANLLALAGISVEVIALLFSSGTRTRSSDAYELVMVLLALTALWMLRPRDFAADGSGERRRPFDSTP